MATNLFGRRASRNPRKEEKMRSRNQERFRRHCIALIWVIFAAGLFASPIVTARADEPAEETDVFAALTCIKPPPRCSPAPAARRDRL